VQGVADGGKLRGADGAEAFRVAATAAAWAAADADAVASAAASATASAPAARSSVAGFGCTPENSRDGDARVGQHGLHGGDHRGRAHGGVGDHDHLVRAGGAGDRGQPGDRAGTEVGNRFRLDHKPVHLGHNGYPPECGW